MKQRGTVWRGAGRSSKHMKGADEMRCWWAIAAGTALAVAAVITWGSGTSGAVFDLSGTWDAQYNITCTAAFDQQAAALTADVDCGGGGVGTLTGTVDVGAGVFSLSGQLGQVPVSVDGTIVDDDSLAGTYSALLLAESASFEGVRVEPGVAGDLTGDWLITLTDVFSGGCTADIEQSGVALTAVLSCSETSPATVEGTLDGATVTLTGPFTGLADLSLEATVSEDGGFMDGLFLLSPAELTGTFAAELRGGPNPTLEAEPTDTGAAPTATPVGVSNLPDAGDGDGDAGMGWEIGAAAVLAALGALAMAAGWHRLRRGT